MNKLTLLSSLVVLLLAAPALALTPFLDLGALGGGGGGAGRWDIELALGDGVVLRLLLRQPLPLNEGLLRAVELELPPGLLNPDFPADPARAPAVVGGNVETSQRIADVLLGALAQAAPDRVPAASQGTMNNVLVGNDDFAYYETVAGGCGAGPGWAGASGVHTHMTNTRITDPEILEHRYPVRLRRFAFRSGSGGSGRWRGGDGRAAGNAELDGPNPGRGAGDGLRPEGRRRGRGAPHFARPRRDLPDGAASRSGGAVCIGRAARAGLCRRPLHRDGHHQCGRRPLRLHTGLDGIRLHGSQRLCRLPRWWPCRCWPTTWSTW